MQLMPKLSGSLIKQTPGVLSIKAWDSDAEKARVNRTIISFKRRVLKQRLKVLQSRCKDTFLTRCFRPSHMSSINLFLVTQSLHNYPQDKVLSCEFAPLSLTHCLAFIHLSNRVIIVSRGNSLAQTPPSTKSPRHSLTEIRITYYKQWLQRARAANEKLNNNVYITFDELVSLDYNIM